MILGSLSRLFVLRLIGRLEPLKEDDISERARRAGLDLEFGFEVTLGQFLGSLTEEGLVTPGKDGFRVTELGRAVLQEVIDPRVNPAVDVATRPLSEIRSINDSNGRVGPPHAARSLSTDATA